MLSQIDINTYIEMKKKIWELEQQNAQLIENVSLLLSEINELREHNKNLNNIISSLLE